jgi:hypothetical protein
VSASIEHGTAVPAWRILDWTVVDWLFPTEVRKSFVSVHFPLSPRFGNNY